MRKTSGNAHQFKLVASKSDRKHGGGRLRLHWPLVILLLLALGGSVVCGQDLQVGSESKATTGGEDRERRALREQWFLRGRSSRAQPGAASRYQAYLQKMRMRAARLASIEKAESKVSPPSTEAWSPLGPVPLASDASGSGEYDYGWVTGRATGVAIDPADPTGNTVYIGGAYGGVWKSTNATQPVTQNSSSVTWTALTDNQATLAVGAIAIQPGNPDPMKSVVLVGTGETNSSLDSYYGLGILRSKDAGNTWELISSDATGTRSFAGMGFSQIAFNSNAVNLAVAATAGASEGIIEGLANPLTANLGLYSSGDSGVSWDYASVNDNGLTTAPGSATSVVYNAVAGEFFAALRYHGFYSSIDSVNWTRLGTQPSVGLSTTACPANPSSSSCPIYRGEIAVVPGRNEMYVWYVDANDFDQGIYSTADGGLTWTEINDAGIINCGDQLGCGTQQGSYDLELAAVPDGGATDLYAGTVNLYKCEITSTSPTCSGTGPNTFLNLTHAYGCSSIAKVHPAQHAVSFLLVNGNTQDVMYFANDGGIYRALDGYSLLTGSCGGSNQFDSLNMTLGSMTQFVSFSEAPTDASTLLGGTQGNGSPGTRSGAGSWQNVNAGDGGYTQISPVNEDEWFVSNPPNAISGVNIFSCLSGPNCHTQDFQDNPVVSSATVGGDTGAYYPPYILDPQSSGELVVGTCRMWRGSSAGGAFTVLSHSFETGGDGICTGGEINLVRSFATGGPLDSNGFSNVIYAGTDGFGPLIPTTPPGGHVWVNPNVAGGLSTWADQTGSINPNSFPISSIAIDTSVPNGLGAYVGIMGFSSAQFPTSHVWQTTNGGGSWTDYTANLPNAPVNAVVVDPATTGSPGRVYAGTDVGVFWSFTASPNWQEVGPAPNSGQGGYLPNVAVTALGLFTQQDSRKVLRASTYGRGVWEFPLSANYSLAISNSPLTVFPSQTVPPFTGTIAALGGYISKVDLSCTGISTCSVAPTFVNPPDPPPGTPLTATVSATQTPGDYVFDLHGSGEDSYHILNDAFFTLKVVDFNLTAPQPNSVTVPPGTDSGPIGFQVTAAGSFAFTVDLSCDAASLPAGASCIFQPNAVNPTAGNPAAVTLTISTTTSVSPGTFRVTIDGSAPSMPTAPIRTQTLSLIIPKDYVLAITNPALQADVNAAPVYYDGTLTSLNSYNSPVNLSCGAGATPPPLTCSASPTPLIPTTNGAPFTVAVASSQCSPPNTPPHTPFRFNIVAQGTDLLQTSHSVPVTFTATSPSQDDFTLEVTPASNTAPVNTPALFNGTLTSTTPCYYYPVHLSCGSNAPPACQFSPATLAPSLSGAQFTLTVSSDVAASYRFQITAVGSDPNATTHSFPNASFISTGGTGSGFSFKITPATSLQSLPAGQPAIYDLDLVPSGGAFPRNATLAYSANCPPLSTCVLSSTQVSKGSGETHVTFTITTTAPVLADAHSTHALGRPIYALWLSLPGLIVVFGGRRQSCKRRKRFVFFWLLALAVPVLWLGIACGGGLQGNGTGNGQAGTPSGNYTMTVSATMSGLPQQTAQVELTVN
jgi:hypothetical protein